jgi:CheY-like chemotaxis protein
MMQNPPILLVEDSDADAELTIRALKAAKINNRVVRACDGVEALDYLFGEGEFSGRNLEDAPVVILLDLNMPRVNGLEVLARIRADERTRCLPVVVLTSSDEDKDRFATYEHKANSYVCKPVDYDQFAKAARQLGLYWAVLNLPPPVVEASIA